MELEPRVVFNRHAAKIGLAYRTALVEATPCPAGTPLILNAPPRHLVPSLVTTQKEGWKITYLDGWAPEQFGTTDVMASEQFIKNFVERKPGIREPRPSFMRAQFIAAGQSYLARPDPAVKPYETIAPEASILMTNDRTGNNILFSLARYETYFNTPVDGMPATPPPSATRIYALKPDPDSEAPVEFVILTTPTKITLSPHRPPFVATPGDRLTRIKNSAAETYAFYPKAYFDKIFITALEP